MPDPEDNAKQTGDTHPPGVEDQAGGSPGAQGGADTGGGALGRDLQDEGRAGKGINQAGYLKDKDAPGTGGDKTT
jgi:hypothetical protein